MTGRHDARYYLPRFTRLEDRVAARATGKLRDYSRQSAGGATPKAEEKEKYYSDDPETGIPFIRVQNLSVSGALSLDDVKLINRETHNGMLARSHVGPDDLLTKITGVGRMAVSSVPPPGFEGNINQHLVRIKTKDRHTSEVLAAYLNTDIAEQLATRRATGGTRPALDYPALRSIPIIFDERILPIASAARDRRNKRLEEAAALLASIDGYLLSELGIALPPETENTLANRTFRVSAHELGGWRFDPHALHPDVEACREAIERLPNSAHLRQVVSFSRDQVAGRQEPLPYVGLEHVQGGTGILLDVEYEEDFGSALMFEPGHVLFPKLRPYLNKVHLADTTGYCSTEFHVLQAKAVSPEFLTLVLRSEITVRQTKHLMTGNTLPRLQTRDIERLPIPIPDKDIQDRIVTYAAKTQSEAVKLTQSAITELESAKREIEAILLESPEQVHQPQNSFALG
jgi:type I restriction enzyme S subunit